VLRQQVVQFHYDKYLASLKDNFVFMPNWNATHRMIELALKNRAHLVMDRNDA
jgi:hypothetical protein